MLRRLVEADLKKWEKYVEKLEEHCKPRGSKLVAATQYKVPTQGDMELPEYIEKCRQITDACLDSQRTPKTRLSGMHFSLDSNVQWCIRSVWKRTKIRLRRFGSLRLLPTSTIAFVKGRLCRLSAQHRQQSQPYSKGQLRFTSYKKSTEIMENQERGMTKTTLQKTRSRME